MKFFVVLCTWLLSLCSGEDFEKIFGGSNAAAGVYPYMTSVQINNQHSCGGSILTKDWILTSAHCFAQNASLPLIRVMVGSTTLGNGSVHQVQRIVPHPNYNSTILSNDLALLRLTTSLVFSSGIQPICIYGSYQPGGKKVFLTGWGSFERNSTRSSRSLQALLNQETISVEECRRVGYATPVTEAHLCTRTSNGTGACRGDSGSPLVDAETRQQVGVVSFASVNCASGKPDVHVRLSSYRDWIKNLTDV